MVIAAHFLAAPLTNSIFYTCLQYLQAKQPEAQFVFFVDESVQRSIAPSENVKIIIVRPAIKNGLMLHYWYRFKLAKQLQKYGADIFISDAAVYTTAVTIPQLVWLNDISFFNKKDSKNYPFASYLRRNFRHSITGAARLIVPQPFIKGELAALYSSFTTKITCIPHGITEFYKPIEAEKNQEFLASFSDAVNYFVCEADQYSAKNLTTILKAYSLFKKRQKSSMKLVVLTHQLQVETYVKDFHLYKYRADVMIEAVTDTERHARVLSAAWAAIYLPADIQSASPVGLQVLRSGVPLIISEHKAAREIFEGAVIYTGLQDKEIAVHMMDLYKDETKRSQMISLGLEQAAAYNWEDACEELWQTFLWHVSYKAH